MKEKIDNWMTWAWRLVIAAALGVCITVGGWAFSRIEELPKVYQTKEQCDKNTARIEEQLKEIDSKIGQGFREVNKQLFDLARDRGE